MDVNKDEKAGKPEGNLAKLIERLGEHLERLEAETMDDAQRSAAEAQRRVKELTKERERLAQEAASWEKRYKDGTLGRLISEAAVAAGAYRPDQIVALLSPRSRWSEDGSQPLLTLDGADGKQNVFEKDRFIDGVKAYLADNPNLAGSGTGGGAGSKPSPAPTLSRNPKTLAELRRMRSQLEDQARLMR